MIFFELDAVDISSLNDGDLRDLVARLCEAELIQQGIPPSGVTWGGAQEAADGGLDVSVKSGGSISNPNFVPREHTGFQVKKHTMGKSACRKEMEEDGKPKAILQALAAQKGAYIIVSGKDDCSERMLSERMNGMKDAVATLAGKDDLHLDFYGRDRLSGWLRRHPSVALWVRSRLGKSLAGWKPFGRWAATPLAQDDEFLVDKHPCVLDANASSKVPIPIPEGIQLTRDRLRQPGSTVRITGLSGVGKTRFAQALFETQVGFEALPASDVIYADLGTDLTPTASELVTYLIASDFATYLVLDNCPPDVHRSLQKQVAASRAKLRLLTIEYDISEDKPEETEVIHLEPSSEETVSKLVLKRFPDLGRINSDRIAEFSGGNARVSLALASRVKADETLSNFSDEDLFRRLFAQRKGNSPELLRSAEALALVYSFNVSQKEYYNELAVLGVIASLTRQTLYRDQAELLRRQLIQQRGNWRAILPHALANRLAKRALENIPPDEINTELFKPENLRLLQSCAHRLGYLHDFERARELAITWFKSGAPLGNIASCDEQYLIVLDYVAPVFPEVVLRAIETAAIAPNFASRENVNFWRFARLLYRLAYDDENFDRVINVLLKFAETERVGETHNSIVGQMRQLFSLYLSGTEATPERRHAFIKKLLISNNQRHHEIAKELLDSALGGRSWTSVGSFHFGARKRGAGWHPKTHEERIDWYSGYIRLLQQLLGSGEGHREDWAKLLLANHFRGLWSTVGCFDALEQIIHEYGQNGKWPKMWISIKEVLAFDSELHSPDMLARLKALESLTAPFDLYSEIEAYALVNPWDHIKWDGESPRDETDKIHEKVIMLGKLASQSTYLDSLGCKLWKTRAQPLRWLGQGIAIGATDRTAMFDLIMGSLQNCQSNSTNALLLEGYIKGVFEVDPSEASCILQRALEMPALKPFIVTLLLEAPIASWTATKLVELARSRELEPWHFEQLRNGRAHELLSDNELAAVLNEINALDQGFFSTIRIMSMRLFGKEHENYKPNHELRAATREAIRRLVSAGRDDFKKFEVHEINPVLEAAFDVSTPEKDVKEVINSLCASIEAHRLYSFDVTAVIAMLVRTYPKLFLDTVFDGREREATLASLIFRDRIYEEGGSLNDAPLSDLLAWCGTDQGRIMKVAESISAYSNSDPVSSPYENPKHMVLSEHIKALLELAQDKVDIVEIIFQDTYPGIWSGSLADILEVRSMAFSELLTHSNHEVRTLAKVRLAEFEHRIRAEREREAANEHRREQRFE